MLQSRFNLTVQIKKKTVKIKKGHPVQMCTMKEINFYWRERFLMRNVSRSKGEYKLKL